VNTQTERIVPTVVTAYNSKEPLISLHIPKTGGTSLRTILLRWFPNGQFLEHYPNNGLLPLRHDCRGPVCIHGHFNSTRGFGVAEYYPHASQFITFLRDPFNRICSLWFFFNEAKRRGSRVPALDGDPDFETWLQRRAATQAAGNNDFSFLRQLPRSPDRERPETAFERGFVFIGITERYTESVAALAAALGKPVPTHVPHVNATQENKASLESYRAFYEQHFSDEYTVYDEARRRNAAAIELLVRTQRPVC